MNKILIYRDEGASSRCMKALVSELHREGLHKKYAVEYADRSLLQSSHWQSQTKLLIFPGGRDVPYDKALRGEGNRNIRKFVEDGGAFLGICAGGYYGCSEIEFEKGGPLEVICTRELGFFPGLASGPAYGPGQFCYRSEKGAKIAQLSLSFENSMAAAYYNGGCAFIDAELYPNVTVLCRYADIDKQPAAAIQCEVGCGKAVLTGLHPEYSGYQIKTKDRHLLELLPLLRKGEESRKKLFRHLLSCLFDNK